MLKKISIIALFLVLTSGNFVFAQVGKNTLCPVMPGERTKDQFNIDYKGEKIYFCCKACVKGFKKNPEKYLKNLK